MGKHKTERTDKLTQSEQAQNHIEQHNFDRLVAKGVIVEGGGCEKAKPPKAAVGA